jgi:exopolysaccharide biosynthesis polyprenyl glycosylphosphotransferase
VNETVSTADGIALPARLPAPAQTARTGAPGSRGRLVRRLLLGADLTGVAIALAGSTLLAGGGRAALSGAAPLAALLLLWPLLASLEGLYDHDEGRTGHSTVDDLAGVIHVATLLALAAYCCSQLTAAGWADPRAGLAFWLLAVVAVTVGRGLARNLARRSPAYLQRVLIVGAGDVGQLLARKIAHHPEYGIDLIGFADASPRPVRPDLAGLPVLGGLDELPALVARLRVERVIVAFTHDPHDRLLEGMRTLRAQGVQIDIVPRLFGLVGPNVELHALEGLPLVGLPTARISRSSAALKRLIDIVGASVGLALTAPLLLLIAIRIRLDSAGPVLFRQTRLGAHMQEFTILKFRTMNVGTDAQEHRSYISAVMSGDAAPTADGIYKLTRADAVTPIGRWLRRTSLDELPQLVNVLRGEMSLVGPRPCIPYETENFEAHHFERFLVPAGITGLWQVTARAHATYGEALDMDVGYARGWSLGLDLLLILRTVRHLLGRRTGATTA